MITNLIPTTIKFGWELITYPLTQTKNSVSSFFLCMYIQIHLKCTQKWVNYTFNKNQGSKNYNNFTLNSNLDCKKFRSTKWLSKLICLKYIYAIILKNNSLIERILIIADLEEE